MMHLLKDLMPQADTTTMRGLLEKPSLAGLSYILRHRELWPANFGPWDYTRCRSCAMGLTISFWQISLGGSGNPSDPYAYCWSMRQAFGLCDADIQHLFFVQSQEGDVGHRAPEYIADHIDNYIAERWAA